MRKFPYGKKRNFRNGKRFFPLKIMNISTNAWLRYLSFFGGLNVWRRPPISGQGYVYPSYVYLFYRQMAHILLQPNLPKKKSVKPYSNKELIGK